MEKKRVYGIEGLDGTGKSTVGKLLADQTASQYLHWMDKNRLRLFKEYFDNSPKHLRFLYFTAVAIDTFFRAEHLRQTADVFIDRTIVSTIAYHKALGVSNAWISIIPQFTLNQIDQLIYFTANDEIRLERMKSREIANGEHISNSDKKSFVISKMVDDEYRKIMPNKTLVVDTSIKTPQEITDDLKQILYLNKFI